MGGGISKRPGKPQGIIDGKAKEGRPPGLTPQIHKEIIDSVELLGMAETRAAMASGFDHSTIVRWKQRGLAASEKWAKLTKKEQESEKRYLEFYTALRDATYKFERANLTVMQHAATHGDWRAAQARLEKVLPLIYGKRMMLGGDKSNPTPIITEVRKVIYLPDNGRDKKPDAAAPTSPTPGA